MVFGRESLEENPAIISLINVNSPLRYDDRMLSAALLEYARANQAMIITPVPLDGRDVARVDRGVARSAGGGGTRRNRARADDPPGLPVVFGSFLSNTDMQVGLAELRHAGVCDSGCSAPDRSLGHYKLPFRGGGALTVVPRRSMHMAAYGAAMTLLADVPRRHELRHAPPRAGSSRVSFPVTRSFIVDVELLRMLHPDSSSR